MSLLQYTITNQSAIAKTFLYFSASAYHNINVGGFGTIIFEADNSFSPQQVPTGVSEDDFVSDSYIPPTGKAWLWNNGEKVQYIKISNTPLTGPNISSIINKADWIEFSMVGAIDKNGSYLYPTAPTSPRIERYIIGNANNKGTYNSIITNDSSPETSIAVAANTASDGTGFSYLDSQFSVTQDCNPLLNNAFDFRPNEWLQDVDYSVNAITPVNFDQLINFTATRATVPQSNYTQLGFIHSRYVGSSTTRAQINEYNPLSPVDIENKLVYDDETSAVYINRGKGPSLGKVPNVELNNAYVAYFDRVIDPYPQLNNKVAYYVKYLIDEGGNILDPNLSNINFSIFTDTFQLRDYDNTPTRVNTAISSIEQGKELAKLTNGLHSVYKIGTYPSPILYTQISSINHVNEISLSGSRFYAALGIDENGEPKDFLKLGINIYNIQSASPDPADKDDPTNYAATDITWNTSTSITPLTNNIAPTTIPTSSVNPTFSLLFPLDPEADSPNSIGSSLSDNYFIKGEFTFPTSTMPAFYRGSAVSSFNGYTESYRELKNITGTKRFTFNLKPYIKPPASGDLKANYINSTEGFEIESVKLKITSDPGGPNEKIEDSIIIESSFEGYGTQWAITPGVGLVLTPNSLYLEKVIIENIFKGDVLNQDLRMRALPLIAGGWADNPVVGVKGIAVKYDWTISFKLNNVKQKTGVYFGYSGILEGQPGDKSWGRPIDTLVHFGSNGEDRQQLQWRRTFNPNFSTGTTKPIIKYTVSSPLSENATFNSAKGPFWRRYPIDGNPANEFTSDMLYMSSSLLNQTYGLSYYQAKLPYIGARNTDFPLTIEPSFIEFDPVVDPWYLEIGDEIRFQNNEDLTYKIISIDGMEEKNLESEDINQKLRVTVFPSFDASNTPTNFDFFIVRRYKENKNFIILDQQMPYGIISTGKGELAFSGEDASVGIEPVNPSSSPGILLPEHRVDKFNANPDLVLKDLIEKGIIT
jgi:hypothetical protein